MENIKLSFIVPVYNVAPYLRKCVDSLLAQDYDDYEIILVDDGSSDESGVICDEYAASSLSAAGTSPFSEADHSIIPIRVIHQVNAGLSSARNAGLKAAKGEYVCFVDSDDFWKQNVLAGLIELVEHEQLDVLRFDYQNINEKNEVYNPNKSSRYIDKESSVVKGETYLNTRMGYACYAVMYIMRREIVPPFTEGIHFEDVDWLPRMMLKAQRVNSTTLVVYNYLTRQGSITKTQGDVIKIRRNIEDKMTILKNYSYLISQHPNCKWLQNMRSSMAEAAITTIARELYSERKNYLQQLRELQVLPLVVDNQGLTYKHRAKLINMVGPYVYCMIMHYKN